MYRVFIFSLFLLGGFVRWVFIFFHFFSFDGFACWVYIFPFFHWAGAGGKTWYICICACDSQSFADGVEGAFSEFGAQSEYDPVVPGGSVNDGVLSDEGSSRWVL